MDEIDAVTDARDLSTDVSGSAGTAAPTDLSLPALLSGALAQAPALIVITSGPAHRVQLVNAAAREVFPTARIGESVEQALPEFAGHGLGARMTDVYRSGEPHLKRGVRLAARDEGSTAPREAYFDVSLQPLRTGDGRVHGVMLHGLEITARVAVERQLKERARLASLAAAVGLALTQAASLREMLQQCVEAVVERLSVAVARAWTVNPGEGVLELQASAGLYTHLDGPHGRVPIGRYKIGKIAEERRPHLTNQVIGDPRVSDQEWARREGMVSFAGYPLLQGEELVGVLAMFSRAPFSPADFDGLATVAQGITIGISRQRSVMALEHRAEELARTAAELQYQRDLTNAITDNTASALFMMDTRGYPVFMNPAAREMTGYGGLEEIRDRPLHYAVHFKKPDGSPYPMEECPIDRANAEIEPLRDQREMFCRRDGSLFPVQYNVMPVIKDRRRLGAVIEVRDITEQERAERELRQRAEELARLARALERSNRELDQFAYVASHDLKAPLRGIANLSQWIEEDLGDALTGTSREHMNLLRGRVQRMEGLIDGILQYSRAGRVRNAEERVDTRQLVTDVIELLAPPEAVRFEIAPDLPVLTTERLPLQQVFLNLIGNAVKYNKSAEPAVRVWASPVREGYEFRVADNGPGIAPRFHDRIWGVFQTLEARDKVEGTGIGLALVKKIVETRGGRAAVESEEGAGATFIFVWPVRRPAPEGAREPSAE